MNDAMDVRGMALERLMKRVAQLERQVARLQHVESAAGCPIVVVDITGTGPPTDAELDGAFGVPADISRGMLKLVEGSTDLGEAVYGAVAVGDGWWYWALTKAV